MIFLKIPFDSEQPPPPPRRRPEAAARVTTPTSTRRRRRRRHRRPLTPPNPTANLRRFVLCLPVFFSVEHFFWPFLCGRKQKKVVRNPFDFRRNRNRPATSAASATSVAALPDAIRSTSPSRTTTSTVSRPSASNVHQKKGRNNLNLTDSKLSLT